MTQKGTQLVGGALTEEVIASTKSIFNTGRFGAGQKGLQQFFTAEPAAKLAAGVIGRSISVFDPTAGNGSLLKFFDPPFSYGVEIDKDQIEEAAGSYHAIHGDIQEVYSILKLAHPEWDAIVANPPFGLQWSDPNMRDGRQTNSAVLTFLYCARWLSESGQMVFIDGRDHFYKHIATLPEAHGVYAVIEVEDLGKNHNFEHPCVIAFAINPAARKAASTGYAKRECSVDMLDLCVSWVTEQRDEAFNHTSFYLATHSYGHHKMPDLFKTVQDEHRRRSEKRLKSQREYDCQLVGGKIIQWMPSAFASIALRQTENAHLFNSLNGQGVNYFLNDERTWNRLVEYSAIGMIRLDPRMFDIVEDLLGEMRRTTAPLYYIKPQQRLGYLTDVEYLKCVKDDPGRSFVAGEKYRLRTASKTIISEKEKLVTNKKTGEAELRKFKTFQSVLAITIGHHTILDGGEEASESIQWLIDHFELPAVAEVGVRYPDEIAACEKLVREVFADFEANSRKYEEKHPELTPFSVRPFQVKDIARLVFKKSGLLAWEQGLGKTLGGLAFSECCVRLGAQDARLFVTAGDLIPQWQREIERFLDRKATVITTHAQAKQIARRLRTMRSKGLFIMHYEGLSQSGTRGKRGSQPADDFTVYEKEVSKQVPFTGRYIQHWIEQVDTGEKHPETGEPIIRPVPRPLKDYYAADAAKKEGRDVQWGHVQAQFETRLVPVTTKQVCPECRADRKNGWTGLFCEYERPDGSKCGYAHFKVRVKPIASMLSRAFLHGVIVLDEVTKIQGATSQMSKALRGLRSRHKLGMTGTPIKNYIHQLYWVLWWCLGNNTKRFGYTYDDGYFQFMSRFSVMEAAIQKDGKLAAKTPTADVTNLSMLWKMLSSSIIRRRMEETDEEIVPIYYYPIQVPLGVGQQEQTDKWLKDFHLLFRELYPESPVVAAGMEQIMAPMLGLQQKLDYAATLPEADPHAEWTGVSVSNWTPASLRVVELAMALVKQGRKVLIGSNLIHTGRWVAEALVEKGVKAIHILDENDQTASAKTRAEKVYSFQNNDMEVFCAGVQAIRLGHNLDAADAVIFHGLNWDFETTDQFTKRVRRLTSKNPIDVFVVLPASESGETITAKKYSRLEQKGGASDLALDGRLNVKATTEVDESEIIAQMMERGLIASASDIPEADIERAFEELPSIHEYVTPDGLIPPRPADTRDLPLWLQGNGFAPGIGVCEFIARLGAAIRSDAEKDAELAAEKQRIVDECAEKALLWRLRREMWTRMSEERAANVVPAAAVLAQNAAEMDEQQPEYEEASAVVAELEAIATKSPDPPPADETAALLKQMQEQMEEMRAEQAKLAAANAELAAEVDRLSNHEQLVLELA